MGDPRATDQPHHLHFNKSSDRIPYLTNMKLFAIVCLALIAAANAAPQGGSFTTLLMTDIAGARASAAEIALAGAGLDQLETQLQAFSADAPKITLAETTVETVATPYVSE